MQRLERKNKGPRRITDITGTLESGRVGKVEKYDLIRAVKVDRIKSNVHTKGRYAGQEVDIGYFYIREHGIRGRVFPMDEIIKRGQYDLLVQKIVNNGQFPHINVDANIYHDFYPGEIIPVRILEIEKDPSFILFNSPQGQVRGYIKKHRDLEIACDIKIGSKVLVEVTDTIERGRTVIFTRSLKLLV